MKGVYIIQSISHPDRIYVGSAKDFDDRWRRHKGDLKKGNHASKQLQRHCSKYGIEDLFFEPIETQCYLDNKHLLAREQHWIYFFRHGCTWKPFFNTCEIAGNTTGVFHTEESNQKNREAHIGKTPWKGKKHKASTIKKQSDIKIGNTYCVGRVYSEETIEKFKAYNGNRPKEHNDNISKAKKGKPSSMKGKTRSKESNIKVSIGLRKYWEIRKANEKG